MTNKATTGGKLKDYTGLSNLQQSKSVCVFGYVHKVAYAFNKDHHGRPQHEYRLSLTDLNSKRPVPFSLFRDAEDKIFRGELREGILLRVHRATCRKLDDGFWLFGKAGVAGLQVVGFERTNVLNVVCTTSASFSFTDLHHGILNGLRRYLKTDLPTDVFAFRSRPIARLVQDGTDAPSTTYTIELLDESLKPGESPPLVAVETDDEGPEVAQELSENAAAVNISPTWAEPNAMESQVTEGVAAIIDDTETEEEEIVNDTQVSLVASPPLAGPTAPKRPCTAPTFPDEPAPVFKNLQTLRSAQLRSYFDCICEVIGVLDHNDSVILRVWDGTRPARSPTRYEHAKALALDSKLEVYARGYWVDIVCWDEHGSSAKGLKPHDKVSIVNLHAFVNKLDLETLTLHGGFHFGRGIKKLRSAALIDRLERQLSVVPRRTALQSQNARDGASLLADIQF